MKSLSLPHALRSAPCHRPAFTLLELILVTVIIAIVAMIALPRASQAQTRLKAATDRLITDIEYAQLASIGRADDRCVMVFDIPGQRYHLARASDPTTPIEHPITHTAYTVEMGQTGTSGFVGIRLDSVTAGGDSVLDFATHGALQENSDATLTLSYGSISKTITVDMDTGTPSVQ